MNNVDEFLAAVNGVRGDLDSWLELNNEEKCRVAIRGAIAAEREACAKVCDDLQKEQGKISLSVKIAMFLDCTSQDASVGRPYDPAHCSAAIRDRRST